MKIVFSKNLNLIMTGFLILSLIILPLDITAQTLATDDHSPCEPTDSLEKCQQKILDQVGAGGYGKTEADTTLLAARIALRAGGVINLVLNFLGVVFLFFVAYSGVEWMTAGGNDEKIKKARRRMLHAGIGLAIVVGAYALTFIIVDFLIG